MVSPVLKICTSHEYMKILRVSHQPTWNFHGRVPSWELQSAHPSHETTIHPGHQDSVQTSKGSWHLRNVFVVFFRW